MAVNVFRNSSVSSVHHQKEQINSSIRPPSSLDRLHKHKVHLATSSTRQRYHSSEESPQHSKHSDCAYAPQQQQQQCQRSSCGRNYGPITPSSSSSNTNLTGAAASNRVNIIRNRFFSYADENEDEPGTVGQYGFENDHTTGCDKRWIRLRGNRGDCGRCSTEARHRHHHLEDNMGEEEEGLGEEEEEEEEETSQGQTEAGERRSHQAKGSQRWRNVKAVMAYYYALRKIKRNVAFVTGSNPINF